MTDQDANERLRLRLVAAGVSEADEVATWTKLRAAEGPLATINRPVPDRSRRKGVDPHNLSRAERVAV